MFNKNNGFHHNHASILLFSITYKPLTINSSHKPIDYPWQNGWFFAWKVPILYNSLIISTYKIGKRKRVTIWLLLKFPELPWFAVVSNSSFINAKINKMRCPTKEKLIFFLSGRLFCCHFDGLIVLLKFFSSSAETSYALSS